MILCRQTHLRSSCFPVFLQNVSNILKYPEIISLIDTRHYASLLIKWCSLQPQITDDIVFWESEIARGGQPLGPGTGASRLTRTHHDIMTHHNTNTRKKRNRTSWDLLLQRRLLLLIISGLWLMSDCDWWWCCWECFPPTSWIITPPTFLIIATRLPPGFRCFSQWCLCTARCHIDAKRSDEAPRSGFFLVLPLEIKGHCQPLLYKVS